MRAAVVEFVRGLDLHDVTPSGESLGGALSRSASIDLKDRVTRVVAFNSYDYPEGGARGNRIARLILSCVRMPVLGPVFARLEPRFIMRAVLQGGYVDKTKLPGDFVADLQALADVHRVTVPRTGHFSALERPGTMARILLDAASS